MVMDLSARIRAINQMNGNKTPEPQPPVQPEAEEPAPVPQEVADPIWADAQKEEAVISLDEVYFMLKGLKEAIENQNKVLEKINKHVNATQKMLKKGK